tara:strand:+ start:7722 stop:8036 length:315 start_codon:yes stop_codon:yes gene_type:complete
MKGFRCKSCGTGFSTTGKEAPPSPNWDDGHVCEMVEVESFIVDKTAYTIGDKVVTGHSHKSIETGELLISKEAKERAFGYMQLKKSQCQGHSEDSDREEDDFNG